jgi:hypothetical protein
LGYLVNIEQIYLPIYWVVLSVLVCDIGWTQVLWVVEGQHPAAAAEEVNTITTLALRFQQPAQVVNVSVH